MPRGSLPATASWYGDDSVTYFNFLKMDWPSPVNTLRWTDYPPRASVLPLNVEGGEFDWDTDHDFQIGQFEQGDQTALAVSDVIFGNANHEFTDLMANFQYGCRGVSIECWVGKFEKDPDPDTGEFVYIGPSLAFSGVMDRAEVSSGSPPDGGTVTVSIISYRNPLTAKFPRRRFSLDWGFKWIPPPNFKITGFGVAGTVTLPTRDKPGTTSGNTVGGGGTPGPIGNDPSGRGTPVLPRPRPGVPTAGGPSRPDPRIVTR